MLHSCTHRLVLGSIFVAIIAFCAGCPESYVSETPVLLGVPVANAGADQTVTAKAAILLDGSGSLDPDDDPLSYTWVQISGPSVVLTDAWAAQPSFIPSEPGVYEFTLTVSDGSQVSRAAMVRITVVAPETIGETVEPPEPPPPPIPPEQPAWSETPMPPQPPVPSQPPSAPTPPSWDEPWLPPEPPTPPARAVMNGEPTVVSGGIYTNATWSTADSPYHVTSNVTVFPDVTLTIEPGVEVRLAPGVVVNVRGHLEAQGTALEPITFGRDDAEDPAFWQGIRFETQQGASGTIRHARFSEAVQAVFQQCCRGGGPLTISESVFSYNRTAVAGYAGDEALIAGCTFDHNAAAASGADKRFYRCVFDANGYAFFAAERVDAHECVFSNNGTALYGCRGTISACSIYGNDYGVLPMHEGFTIRGSTFTVNGIGLIVGGIDSVPAVNNCNIFDNSTNVWLQWSSNVNLTQNWWGTTETDLIRASNFDGYDDVNLGLIVFEPIRTEPVLVACP